jgi:Cu/Zn superoxide dismutase
MPRGKVTQVKVVGKITPLLASLALMMLLLSGCGGSSRASQEQTAEGKSTSTVRLELSPTNNSGVSGSVTFAKTATGTRVELDLRGLPEPEEIYLAHVHPGSCEDEEHTNVLESEAAHRQDQEHSHDEYTDAHEQEENGEAAANEIEYPLTPVESNAAGEGSSTTVLEDVALDELLPDGPRYLNVHAAEAGDQPQLTCTDIDGAELRTTPENTNT